MNDLLLDLYREYRPWYDEAYDIDQCRGTTALEVLEPLMKAAGLPRPTDWPADLHDVYQGARLLPRDPAAW